MDLQRQLLIMVDAYSVILAMGGIIVVALAAKPRRNLVIASALCGGLAGLLIAAAPAGGAWQTSAIGLVGGGAVGVVLALGLARLLSIDTGRLAWLGRLRGFLVAIVLPAQWPIAQGKPPMTIRDLAKRCFVTIAASTGGVVGTLIDLDTLGPTILGVLEPRRLFALLVLTTVSVTLVGPLHEYVVDRGGHPAGPDPHPPLGEAIAQLWEHLSWRSAGRLLLTLFALMEMEFTYDSLHGSMQQGNTEVLIQILLGGLTPGIVSYYWSAALQYEAPSIRASTWRPSLVLGMVMLFGYGAFLVVVFAVLGVALMWSGEPDLSLVFACVVSIVVGSGLALAALLAFSAITVASYAWAGGYAIDRVRGSEPTFYILAALLVPTALQEALALSLIAAFGMAPGLSDYFMLFPGTIVWVVGLWASGFPGLVKRRARVPSEITAA